MPTDPLSTTIDSIRSYGAVAVLGAGLSMPRYPMTRQLPALLAHAFDAHPPERSALAADLGEPDGPAKHLLSSDEAIERAWTALQVSAAVRAEFQQAVARHDLDQEPLSAHRALARLIAAGTIDYVVSFNWDTALERAYEQQFGVPLPAGTLSKPHGDAADPGQPWVLPHEDGVITDDVRARVAELVADRPRLLLIVGYSGSDAAVVEHLIDPVRERWPTATISPSAKGPEGIAGTADEVLPEMADRLGATGAIPGWLWVTYHHHRDIGAALLGHKLGPQDVDACPSASAVATAAEHLRIGRYAAISGDSGCGKSLAAFQAARLLNLEGWAVVELVNQGVASEEDVHEFSALAGPVVAVVDDAQAMDPAVRARFERAANDRHAVLLVTTDLGSGAAHSTIARAQAVDLLARYCREHRPEIQPRVSAIDDRVGDESITQERYLDRVDLAGKAGTPWEFMFVLSGGDRQITAALGALADLTDGPLLLGLLAAAQTLSLDAGVDRDRLRDHALDAGLDLAAVDAGVEALLDARLATSRDGQLRTPHLRFAQRALRTLCRDRSGAHWERFIGFLRQRVLDRAEPLLGRLWLLRDLHQIDEVRYGPSRVITATEASAILDEVLPTGPGRDRSIAGHIIWELDWFHAIDEPGSQRVARQLIEWINELDGVEIYGVESAFGSLRSRHAAEATRVASELSPERVAHIVAERFEGHAGREWGHLLTGLVDSSELERDEWYARFEAALDVDQLIERIAAADDDVLWSVLEFVNDLTPLAAHAGARGIRTLTPKLSRLLETDLATAASYLVDWVFGILGFAAYTDHPEPMPDGWQEVVDAIVDLVRSTDWTAAGASVAHAELRDLDQLDVLGYTISKLDPDAWTRAVAAVDLDHLDGITAGLWSSPSRVDRLVETLAQGNDQTYARSWVVRHRAEIQTAPVGIAGVSPEVAVEVISRGGEVDLGLSGGPRWDLSARAVRALASVDPAVARYVVARAEPDLRSALELRDPHDADGVIKFVEALDDLDPGLLTEILSRADLGAARARWEERAQGSDEEQAAAAVLLLERSRDL